MCGVSWPTDDAAAEWQEWIDCVHEQRSGPQLPTNHRVSRLLLAASLSVHTLVLKPSLVSCEEALQANYQALRKRKEMYLIKDTHGNTWKCNITPISCGRIIWMGSAITPLANIFCRVSLSVSLVLFWNLFSLLTVSLVLLPVFFLNCSHLGSTAHEYKSSSPPLAFGGLLCRLPGSSSGQYQSSTLCLFFQICSCVFLVTLPSPVASTYVDRDELEPSQTSMLLLFFFDAHFVCFSMKCPIFVICCPHQIL